MTLAKKLEQLGFSEKEAKVYVALLEVGEATPHEIAIKSGINRATAYVILEHLKKQDLASTVSKKNKIYYTLEPPLNLLDSFDQEKQEIESKIGKARKLMPELEMLERMSSEKAKVKIFEGKESLNIVRKDILRSGCKEVYNIFNISLGLKYFPQSSTDHRDVLRKMVTNKKMKSKVITIYNSNKPTDHLPYLYSEERKYLPYKKFPFDCDFVFYGEKVILFSFQDLLAIIIENKSICIGLKAMFNYIWEGAEKYPSLKQGNKSKK